MTLCERCELAGQAHCEQCYLADPCHGCEYKNNCEGQCARVCGTCKFFTGIGDYNLSCSNPNPHPDDYFGAICYKNTPACDMWEPKE